MPLGFDQELMRMLMDTFAIELEEQLQVITDGLLVLEKGAAGDEQRQVLEGVFRAAHNIKGAARGVEVNDVSDIAHHLESIFAVLKRESRNPDGEVTDIVLEAMDAIRQAMAAFDAGRSFDKEGLILRLEKVASLVEQPSAMPVTSVAEEGAGPADSAVINALPVHATQKTASSSMAPAVPPVERIAPTGADEDAESVNTSESARARPSAEVVRISREKLENLAAMMEALQVTKIEMDDHLASLQQLRNSVQALVVPHRASPPDAAAQKRSADAIAELDSSSARTHREMRSSCSRLGLLVESLQQNVRMMRQVPVASLLRPLSRQVRDIARELGKKINFEISGDEIEIDRMVLEGIRDPLIHLLRNALDHGIELPQQRLEDGKPAEGRLHISVLSEGSQVVLTVEDDGAGISAEKIADCARKKKLVVDAELASMGREEIMNLIFRPGFSSRDIITSMSGRGVGLDVVVANLRKLKGSVQLETEEGHGTRFILRLPITLATEHGVLVRAGGVVFAIPVSAVDKVMEIESCQIIKIEASHAILHRGHSIPLRDLAAILSLAESEVSHKKSMPVVVVAKGWDSVAFLVDEVIGEREIVVKPFRPPLLSVRNVNGGTLTGSGEVIMVLNPSDLVDSALSASLATPRDDGAESAPVPSVLVVDDSITTRTLEKSILEHAGYKVSVAVNGRQGWLMLQEQTFDLVVTDIEMPEMNGFELTALIKQSERLKAVPVIIVTSLAREEDRLRGIEVGAEAYIVKGQFETKVLLDVVEQLI
ncbi:MAG: hybrid sensor histidine kinase/response regulator [Gallionella sp.]|nr:hybrid sensor histidine kinase/response regulator [Gallionella sp.]